MRLAIDPGHGMSNRLPEVFDTGAVAGGTTEAAVVLDYGHALRREALSRGWEVIMTRSSQTMRCPLESRVPIARRQGCDALVSLHCNAAESETATGTETLFRSSDWLARRLQEVLVEVLGLRDRGSKLRNDLAVLKFERPCALVELGFLTNPWDRQVLLSDGQADRVAVAICGVLAA